MDLSTRASLSDPNKLQSMDPDGVPPPARKQLRPADLVKNSFVEYYSRSHSIWIPTRIREVNVETGEVTIEIKAKTPIPSSEVKKYLRKVTRPSRDQLEWLRQCIGSNKIDDEGRKLFRRFTSSSSGIPASSMRELGRECDALFGVSGWEGVIKDQCGLRSESIASDKWLRCFRDHAAWIHENYGNVLTASPTPCHHADPKKTFDFQGSLGTGTYGTVLLALDRVNKARRAVKVISKKSISWLPPGQTDPEIENLLAMDHPHIVKLYEIYDFGDSIYMVMDFCCGGEISSEIERRRGLTQPFREEFIGDFMKQLLSAIACMHGRGLMHLDLKGANIMLTSCKPTLPPAKIADGLTLAPPQERPHVMVIDLGLGLFVRPGNLQAGVIDPRGTPYSMAPEVWNLEFTPKADIFSMGIVFFQMMSFDVPFPGMAPEVEKSIEYWAGKPEAPWEKVRKYSDDAIQLCKSMLNQKRQERPAAGDCLQSPFIRRTSGPGLCTSQQSPDVQQKIEQIRILPERSLLYRSVALSIAQAWPANQVNSVKRIFEHMDIDGNGQLQCPQIVAVLKECGVPKAEAIASANSMALTRKGVVHWTEFVAACIDLGDVSLEEDLRKIFDRADKDCDGLLSQKDVGDMLAGPHLRGQVLRDIFCNLSGSSNPDQVVDWPAFHSHFRAPATSHSYRQPPPPAPGFKKQPCFDNIGQLFAKLLAEALDEASCRSSVWEKKAAPVKAVPAGCEPIPPLELLEDKLQDMGYSKSDVNLRALRRHGSDVGEAVASKLVSEIERFTEGRMR